MCACACVCVCLCVVSVTVKRPVLPPCVVDGRSRNPLYYYYYYIIYYMAAAVSARSVYTIQPSTMSRHYIQSDIRSVHASLAVTCHLHF